jgi:hypothetical protein
MSETVNNLVDAIKSGDALATEQAFAAAMAEKLSAKIDDMRQAVASNMFAQRRAAQMANEETDLDEAFINGREYASQGVMHPDHAKMHKVGNQTDFYAHGTGDKISGKVTKNDGKEVHFQADKSSGGKVHKFTVSSNLPKQQNEAYDSPLDTPEQKKAREDLTKVLKDIKKTNPKHPAVQDVKEEQELDEDLSKWSTEKLQKHWDSHKDEERPAPAFAAQLKRVSQELSKRKKIKEEAELEEGYRGNSEADKPYFDAQDHKQAAEKARKSGDHFSYHKHMSAHHDAMEHWSNNKGRIYVANQHAMKADEHEDYAHRLREDYAQQAAEEVVVDDQTKVTQ